MLEERECCAQDYAFSDDLLSKAGKDPAENGLEDSPLFLAIQETKGLTGTVRTYRHLPCQDSSYLTSHRPGCLGRCTSGQWLLEPGRLSAGRSKRAACCLPQYESQAWQRCLLILR